MPSLPGLLELDPNILTGRAAPTPPSPPVAATRGRGSGSTGRRRRADSAGPPSPQGPVFLTEPLSATPHRAVSPAQPGTETGSLTSRRARVGRWENVGGV